MRRLIQETIEDSIAAGLLDESYRKGDVVSVAAKKSLETKQPELTYASASE